MRRSTPYPAWLLLATLLFLLPSPASGSDFTILTHDLDDQAYTDPKTGELRGREHSGKRAFNLEVVRALLHMLGYEPDIREVSFAEGITQLESQPDVVFFNIYRTPQREHRFKWIGPLQREVDYLYGLAGSKDIDNLDAAREVPSICTVDGSQHHRVLLARGFTNVVPADTYSECFARLKRGETTLAVSSEETLLQKLRKVGIPATDIHRVPVALVQSAGYIAFSPNVDDKTLAEWQAAFNALVGSGQYQELYELYYGR